MSAERFHRSSKPTQRGRQELGVTDRVLAGLRGPGPGLHTEVSSRPGLQMGNRLGGEATHLEPDGLQEAPRRLDTLPTSASAEAPSTVLRAGALA